MDLTFKTIDDVNQIGEFYNAIMKALDNLSAKKLIEFKADDKEHKQRQCKSKKKETDDVTSVEDAKDAIELICVQGEGYQLKAGVFGAVAKSDGDENMANDVGTSEKTHFIKFIECLVGREVLKLEVVKEDKGTSTYRFTYGEGSKYAVDFEKEVYPMSNFEKAADDDMFNKYYKDMLEKLTEGLKVGEIGDSVKAMHGLRDRFKECMDKCVYPTFEVKDFPLPPSVVSDK